MTDRIQWVSPTPPLRTGIANYTADMFAAVDGRWRIAAIGEDGSAVGHYKSISALPQRRFRDDLPTVIHLGNSEFHDFGFDTARRMSAIVVLHDTFLHHAHASRAIRQGRTRQYWQDLQGEYGDAGVRAGRDLFAGRDPVDLASFPMFEPYARKARAIVVHNRAAHEAVRSRVPDARVHVVPMGIPIPAAFPRDVSRSSLGLPEGAFVICSITHVNPNKRISVVLRAMRRLISGIPNAILVLAGTGSDSDDLTREIEILRLRDHVRQFGYVDDPMARAIASASDACVNLRYPTTGETSASLLRLLGAGLPVLVTDAGASAELPDGVGLRVPIGEHEVDIIAALLKNLAEDPDLRADAGLAAKEFVRSRHSMANMVDGYREVLKAVYGLRFPGIDEIPHEEMPMPSVRRVDEFVAPIAVRAVAAAISELGLSRESVASSIAGQAITELGLNRGSLQPSGEPSARLLDRVLCPDCGGAVDKSSTCAVCGRQLCRRGSVLDLRGKLDCGEQTF